MIVLMIALPLAVLAHEGAHWAVLKAAGAKPELALRRGWDRRLLLSAGLGWAYATEGVSVAMRRASYLAGPLAGVTVWLLAALTAGGWWALWCVAIGTLEWAGNWWGPSSDGRAWRRLG